jgi:hypothetical protein
VLRIGGTIAALVLLSLVGTEAKGQDGGPDPTQTLTQTVPTPAARKPAPSPTQAGTTVPADAVATNSRGVTEARSDDDVSTGGPVVERKIARDASRQGRQTKKAEATISCASGPPPTGRMIAVGAAVTGEDGERPPTWPFIVGGVALVLLAIALLAVTHRLGEFVKRGLLETVSIVAGIAAALGGLAVAFVPGVGVEKHPPPEATMTVREVHPRITHGEYARAVSTRRLDRRPAPRKLGPLDRREIGNVVWLELRLSGYRRRLLTVHWSEFDRTAANNKTLIPGTSKTAPLRTGDSDRQTFFLPVWVGYPNRAKFEVRFRLLDGRQVRQLARTGAMNAPEYRYACPQRD